MFSAIKLSLTDIIKSLWRTFSDFYSLLFFKIVALRPCCSLKIKKKYRRNVHKQKSVKSFRLLTVLKCIAPRIRRNIEKWEEYGNRCKSENLLTCCQKINKTFWKFYFLKMVYFLPASWIALILKPAWRRKGTPFPIIIYVYYIQKLYVEAFLLSCCINSIFHMSKVAFEILWTIIRSFIWGCPHIFSASFLIWKISQPDEIDEEHLFWGIFLKKFYDLRILIVKMYLVLYFKAISLRVCQCN